MSKPPFDPNQTFASAKPEFDPNAPFTPSDQQPSQPSPSFMDTVGSAVKSLNPMNVAKNLTPEKLSAIPGALPTAGAAFGALAGPAGIAAGAGVGQTLSRMADMGYGRAQPESAGSNFAPKEAIGPVAQTAMAGVPEVQGVRNAIQEGAQNLARRALGFTKPMLKRWNFGVPEANQVGQQMLDQGVIKFGASSADNLERAKALAQQSGSAIGDTLAAANAKIVNPKDISNVVENQLAPDYGAHIERSFIPTAIKNEASKIPLFTEQKVAGGAYDKTKNIVNEIERTIKAHGNSPVDFASAQDLKEKLGSIANFLKDQAPERSELYRRAYGIVSDAIDKGLGQAETMGALPQGQVAQYTANKSIYGASRRAIEALSDKAAADSANSLLSLRGAAVGAGALSSGNIPKAAEAMGLWELARRRGAGMGASTLNSINKSMPVMENARRAAYASFISKITTKDNQ